MEKLFTHKTQSKRKKVLKWIEGEIIRLGGMQKISKAVGRKDFVFFIAQELGSTLRKSEEYLDLCINASLARGRIQTLDAKNQSDRKRELRRIARQNDKKNVGKA